MVVIRTARRNVRILLVGDRGVGKTSLILSLVSEEFPEDVPAKAEEITIPADVTPEQVPTNIVDYSAVEQTDENLIEEIQRAHVICVVYSVDDDDSFDRVTSYWLPFIRECTPDRRCPVVLVGNKVDLIDYSTIDSSLSVMEEFQEIESCIECSAKTLKNISELFFYAQKAVLHPTGPLYVIETEELTEACQRALTRIFKICDMDNDNLLNDFELNSFQCYCFNSPLQPQVLEDVKAVLRRNVDDGIYRDSITLNGFLFLHKLFMQRGRNETIWGVLRKFGYNDNLQISKEYLFPVLKIPSGASAELSHRGQHFFQFLFERYDKDKDGALSPAEQEDMFSACPIPPWSSDYHLTVPTNDKGWMTLQGFMCQWTLITLVDLPRTLEYLAYLGFCLMENDSQVSAIQVTREKKLDLLKKQSSRNVYQCHVIGPKNSGKSAFCRSFLGKNDALTFKATERSVLSINTVQVYGQEKYLVLRDINVRNMTDPLLPSEVQCDVACLVYDVNNPKSFEYIARIYIKYFAESKIPVLIVSNKSDLEEVKQDYLLQPATFCSKYKIMPPQPFSSSETPRKDVFVKLATMAAFPPLRRMVHMLLLRPNPSEWFNTFYRHLRQFGLMPNDSTAWWKAGLSLAAATAVGFIVVKVLSTDKVRFSRPALFQNFLVSGLVGCDTIVFLPGVSSTTAVDVFKDGVTWTSCRYQERIETNPVAISKQWNVIMENYRKGKNVEKLWDRESIPILNLPENFLWMHVMGGSKIHNLLDYAFQKFPKETRVIVWSGSGAAVAKAVSCAEIMKRECKDVHQVNRICYRKIEEYWEPLLEDLDPIVVNRNIPAIHIMLSLDPVNSEQPGYQAPRSKKTLVNRNRSSSHWKQQRTSADKRRGDTPTKQFAAMGVKDNKQQKKPKQSQSNQPQQQ